MAPTRPAHVLPDDRVDVGGDARGGGSNVGAGLGNGPEVGGVTAIMTMQPKHSVLFHDLRPTNEAIRHELTRFERGEITMDQATAAIHGLAATIPGIDPSQYSGQMSKLLLGRNVARARKLVDCLGDRTLRPWVLPTARTVGFLVKWGLILGAVFVVVRCAVG